MMGFSRMGTASQPGSVLLSQSSDMMDLNARLEPLRQKFGLPALAAAVVRGEKIVGQGAVGVRKQGSHEMVTLTDKFHIGSNTKSMTATIAAMLVEEGKLSWQTTLSEVFPEIKTMSAQYQAVTLEQLLSHRSGAPENLDQDALWSRIRAHQGTPTEQRMFLLKNLTAQPPEVSPGTKFIYSNAGVVMAGAMLEKVTGKTWEDLMQKMLFDPLGMTAAGFGAPASPDKVDQPWGHLFLLGKLSPIPPGPGADNPAAIGPAGTVHCSIGDYAKYAAFHLQGANGKGKLLKAETFTKLHTPVSGQDYALGWIAVERDWAGGRALTHAGSNTMFFALIWIAPRKNIAVVVATNLGSDKAFEGCDQTVSALIQD